MPSTSINFSGGPIWQQAFRPFFLFGSAFAVIAMVLWLAFLHGWVSFSPHGGLRFWHAHEMLFGFVGAIIAGFLLTAVQNWTNLRATHGRPLMFLVFLWFLARISMLVGVQNYQWLPALFNAAFYFLAAFFFLTIVWRGKNSRNAFFGIILLAFAGLSFAAHLSVLQSKLAYFDWGIYGVIFLITLVMFIIGNRIIPMFTANGVNIPKPSIPNWLLVTALMLLIFVAIIYTSGINTFLPATWLALLFTLAAISQISIALLWFNPAIFKQPLVWSLHLSYLFIPFGLCLLALHYWGFSITFSNALHALTSGAMSSLILAMISRVSLGHTGRKLAVGNLISLAFILMISAGIIRVMLNSHLSQYGLLLSGTLWSLSFLIFIVIYFPILSTPRADGRPG